MNLAGFEVRADRGMRAVGLEELRVEANRGVITIGIIEGRSLLELLIINDASDANRQDIGNENVVN